MASHSPIIRKQEEIQTRRDDVLTLLLRGHKTKEICEEIQEKYGVARTTVEKDLTVCYQEIEQNSDPDLPPKVNTHLMKYNRVFNSAMKSKDHRSAIEALKGIERILHIAEDVPLIAIQNNSLNLEKLSLPELQALLK